MFKFKIVISLIFYFLLSQPLYACELSVRILYSPTLGVQDNKGNRSAADIEYIKALLDKTNCTFKLFQAPFARGLKLLENGDIDMAINISKTEQRESYLHFIGPQHIEKIRLVSRKDSIPLIHNWQQMTSLKATFVQQRGTYFGIKMDNIFNTNEQLVQHLVLISNNDIKINLIKKNRADAFLIESARLSYQLRTNPAYKIIEVHPLVINSEPVYYAFSKKSISKKQIEIFEKAYQELIKTDILQKIENKYTSFN